MTRIRNKTRRKRDRWRPFVIQCALKIDRCVTGSTLPSLLMVFDHIIPFFASLYFFPIIPSSLDFYCCVQGLMTGSTDPNYNFTAGHNHVDVCRRLAKDGACTPQKINVSTKKIILFVSLSENLVCFEPCVKFDKRPHEW